MDQKNAWLLQINNNLDFIDSMHWLNTFQLMMLNIHHKNLVVIIWTFEYMESCEKFFDEKLRDRCEFFSSLKDECISEKDYSRATQVLYNVWNAFKMNTMGGYQ